MNIQKTLTVEFALKENYVENIIKLIDEGNTIPFIARYRKELTGSIDDQVLRELSERLEYMRGLEKRKGEISVSLSTLNVLTDEIQASIDSAKTMAELEDIYRPYKPKRRTKATIAKEKGLEPLADIIFDQAIKAGDVEALAIVYVDLEKGVVGIKEALDGAKDIIAERISDDAAIRKLLREHMQRAALLTTKANKEEDSVYRMYYEFSEPITRLASHRILAINRGEKEDFLKVSIDIDKNVLLSMVKHKTVKQPSITTSLVEEASQDALERLILPSIERELRSDMTDRAQSAAIKVFSTNLRPLLLQPPVKGKVTLGLDPAFRTGCKIAVIDATGKVLDTTVIYPTPPQSKVHEAKQSLLKLIAKHNVSTISIGNGTASKESEMFVSELISEYKLNVQYMVVSEAGASVYSASKLAASEFPEFDVSLRSAVSIARRFQDPLAELVKIDPKAIGVGQYQHDLKEAQLDEALTGVVEDCVNSVGVDVNTASASLLSYVSGIGPTLAQNIVKYREEKGTLSTRRELLKVTKLGPKAYEQCAGFLRVAGSKNVLDNTSVHPESYAAAETVLMLCGYTDNDVVKGTLSEIQARIDSIGTAEVARRANIGEPTLKDIVKELLKPGRDPRDELPPPMLRTDVLDMKDLKVGMELMGTVRNCVDFGAFIDIGVHQDGLVHISQIGSRFIKHPSEALKVGDIIKVWVIEVDVKRKRIALTMREPYAAKESK